ncbi:adenylosuccinate lyase [bacterium]|jgi:adenylosuccinate lyase|nr:adenylosuccinate lyase [bacterium]MBT4335428.1 adenylosuccinate lyase [bacterium]MBT4495759.1 adenylosuccinate lyase [bacterium]MBT4763957.1 adenylosuccinate lyase [bacterium]MBT5401328.1 adenylosuccinate lyase [bacterium]
MDTLNAISPLDGRYQDKIKELSKYFSESALIRYRLKIEIEYFIALSLEPKIKEVREFSDEEIVSLRTLYLKFNEKDALQVKKIEKKTNHDVKAVEYFLKNNLPDTLKEFSEFIHFALTSEDINNLAYSLMLKDGYNEYLKSLKKLLKNLKGLSLDYKRIPLLSLTHGQAATPTTIGKEFAVFYMRLKDQIQPFTLKGKLSGAVGNFNAQKQAYSNVDWFSFSQNFVESLGLEYNAITTQIEPHDSLSYVYHQISRINNIVRDLDQDLWLYISRDIFKLKKKSGEVGSSTMPHKVNPIDFENSEGNLGLANALLIYMANKLPISRMQRDLTDSTTLRNQGIALGYSLLALKSTLKGLGKLEVNRTRCREELDENWQVLAEPIQVVLRKVSFPKPYETLKELTQGKKIDQEKITKFIKKLKISKVEKDKLLKLTPSKYIGESIKLIDKYIK